MASLVGVFIKRQGTPGHNNCFPSRCTLLIVSLRSCVPRKLDPEDFASHLDKAQYGELCVSKIGLIGVPFVCKFGSCCTCGFHPCKGYSIDHSGLFRRSKSYRNWFFCLKGWTLCEFWLFAQYCLHRLNAIRRVGDHNANFFIWLG